MNYDDSEEVNVGLGKDPAKKIEIAAAISSVVPITVHHRCPSGDHDDDHGDGHGIDDEDVNEEDSE